MAADTSEKLQSLKSLNSMLLKETVERRQQVDSLGQAKEALQSELTRSVMEREALGVELNRAEQENAVLEVEKAVFFVYMETQSAQLNADVQKMKRHHDTQIGVLDKKVIELIADVEKGKDYLSRVCEEKDKVKGDLDYWVEEAKVLTSKMDETEKLVQKSQDEVGDLKIAYGVLVEKNEGTEQAIAAALTEKSLVQSELEKAFMVIENLKTQIMENAREKKEMEVEKSGIQVKIVELEKEVTGLNAIVLNLQNEELVLSAKVLELENRCGEATENKKDALLEINALLEALREKKRNIEILIEEKESVEKLLEIAVKESEDKGRRIESIIRSRNEMEELKAIQQSEISELNNKANDLRADVVTLQEACREHKEKERKLVSEILHYKDTLDSLKLQRDAAQKHFDEEKKNGMDLKFKISEKDKMIEKTVEELGRTRDELSDLIVEEEEMKTAMTLLVTEKDITNQSLLDAQRKVDNLKVELASAGIHSERTLSMLRSTGSLLCQSKHDRDLKEDVGMSGHETEKQMLPYSAELDAIKSAFKSKETMLENLNRQLELLQTSLANAHKKKRFWTMLCSATTVFAAASIAYVARAR